MSKELNIFTILWYGIFCANLVPFCWPGHILYHHRVSPPNHLSFRSHFILLKITTHMVLLHYKLWLQPVSLTWYNICSTWFLDIRISTCSRMKWYWCTYADWILSLILYMAVCLKWIVSQMDGILLIHWKAYAVHYKFSWIFRKICSHELTSLCIVIVNM